METDRGSRVLVAIDGSAAANDAIELVSQMRLPPESTVDVITVVRPIEAALGPWTASPMYWLPAQMERSTTLEHEAHRSALELVRGARFHLTSDGRRVESAVLYGRPADAILDRARTTRADLIVAGSRGHSSIAAMLLGSVSAELLDRADRPVLIARGAGMERIVLAVDASDAARHAAKLIANWSMFSRSSVLVISVAPVGPPWWTGFRDSASEEIASAYADVAGRSHDLHERFTQEVADDLGSAGVRTETRRLEGDPAPCIIDASREWRADLIVMGSRGRTGLTRAMLGSVSRNVASHAPCSVLVTHAVGGEVDAG